MILSGLNVWIMIHAIFLAGLASAVYWRNLSVVLFPYCKKGDCTQAGFVPLGILFSKFPYFRRVASRKFIWPLFSTTYLFVLIILNYLAYPEWNTQGGPLKSVAVLWFLVVLLLGNIRLLLVVVVVPFTIGYLLFRSYLGGYIGVVIILTILYAASLDEVFVRDQTTLRVRLQSGRSLTGKPFNWFQKFKLRLSSSRGFLELAAFLFTLYSFLENSNFSLDDLALRYISNRPDNPFLSLALVLFFINISLRIFNGVFDYLQTDFYAVLGRLIHLKHNKPEEYEKYEQTFDATLQLQGVNSYGSRLNLAATDRFFDLGKIDDYRFKITFYVFSLDVLLTAAAVLGIPIFPGLSLEQTTTLSTVLKIPIMIIFVLTNVNTWMLNRFSKNSPNYYAKIYRLEIERMHRRFEDLEKLLKLIQEQQPSDESYVDVGENAYLLSLVDARKL